MLLTSEVELAFLDGVECRGNRLNEFGCELHGGGGTRQADMHGVGTACRTKPE